MDAREVALREWEESMITNGGGQAPPTAVTTNTTRVAVAQEANSKSSATPLKPRPPRRERGRPTSGTALRRYAGDRRQQQLGRGSRPARAGRKAGNCIVDSSDRPSSSQSSGNSLGMTPAKKEEAALIAKCRALEAARRKAVAAAAQRRQPLDPMSYRPEHRVNQTPQADPPQHPEKAKGVDANPRKIGLDYGNGGDDPTTAVPRPEDNGRVTEVRAAARSAATAAATRIPRRPQSAAATGRIGVCPRPTSRPRSASTPRSGSAGSRGARGGYRSAPEGRETGSAKVRELLCVERQCMESSIICGIHNHLLFTINLL